MKLTRLTCALGVVIACVTCLSPDTAHAQQIPPSSYIFVEVRDTGGAAVGDAAVTVTVPGGNEIISERTDKDGVAKHRGHRAGALYYNLSVSKPGYLKSEHVFFLYPADGPHRSYYAAEALPESAGQFKGPEPPRINVALVRTPSTTAERRAAEAAERNRRFLLAAKRSDGAELRGLLGEGVGAGTADDRGVPAVAWSAFAGDAESVHVLLAAGADVRDKSKPGHRALLLYLAEGIPRAKSRHEQLSVARLEGTVRALAEAGAGVNVRNSYSGTILNRAISLTPYFGQPVSVLSPETIKFLIAAGADVNAADGSGRTPLMLAAEKRSVELVRMLLAAGAGASANAKDERGQTALMYAPTQDEPGAEIVKALVAAGADLNAANAEGRTALMLASWTKSTTTVKALLASKTPTGAKDGNGQTALMYAGQSHVADIIKALIEAGAPVDERDQKGRTPLMYAAPRYYNSSGTEAVKVLAAAGANVNAADQDGQTALMLAARWYDEEVIKTLIGAGASVNAKDRQGQTALVHALQHGPPIDPAIFIRAGAGASVNQKDARGWTALMYALPRAYALTEMKPLLEAGADVNAANAEGQTPLMLAAQVGAAEVIKTLLGAGASVNAKDARGQTALMHVKPRYKSESAAEAAAALVAAGADANAADAEGQTALMSAAQSGSTEVIKVLLEAGASVNAKDRRGRTALMAGVRGEGRRDETVSLLLASGADVGARDDEGQTALMIARKNGGGPFLVKLLEEAEARR